MDRVASREVWNGEQHTQAASAVHACGALSAFADEVKW
jgi:hypothetical protein